MKKEYFKFIIIGVVVLALLGTVNLFNGDTLVGSVTVGNEYKSQNMSLISTTSPTLLRTRTGALGSVVFATTSDAAVTLYDVAAAANYASTTLSTKIVSFATGTVAGTYTLDLEFSKGLVIYAPATTSKEVVVTYR